MAPRASGRLLPPAVLPFTVRLQALAAPRVRETHFEQFSFLEAKAPQPPSSPPGGRRADSESLSTEQRHRAAGGAPVENGETSGGLPPSADTYYTAQDLDVYPTPRAPLKLEHPNGAGRTRVSGQVLVVLALNEAGIPDDVSILRSEPQNYFEDAARAALAGARFFPAQKDGHPVKSRIQIRLEFERD